MPRQKHLLRSRIVVKNFFLDLYNTKPNLLIGMGMLVGAWGHEPQTPTVSRCGRDQLVADREAS